MCKKNKYTALSRANCLEQVCFGNYRSNEGFSKDKNYKSCWTEEKRKNEKWNSGTTNERKSTSAVSTGSTATNHRPRRDTSSRYLIEIPHRDTDVQLSYTAQLQLQLRQQQWHRLMPYEWYLRHTHTQIHKHIRVKTKRRPRNAHVCSHLHMCLSCLVSTCMCCMCCGETGKIFCEQHYLTDYYTH